MSEVKSEMSQSGSNKNIAPEKKGFLLRRLFKKKSEPAHELALPSEEKTETPIPPLYVPEMNGTFLDPKTGKVINEERKVTEKELKEFFTQGNIKRLIYCPKINIDETDDLGMFGYEPGYIFVNKRNYMGEHNLADTMMFEGVGSEMLETKSEHKVQVLSHYDFFPKNKFEKQLLTPSRTPATFAFLRKLLDNVNPEDLSTYPMEDLFYQFKFLKRRLPDEDILKSSEDNKFYAREAEKAGKSEDAKHYSEIAKIEGETYKKAQDNLPETIKKYLILLREYSRRPETKNPAILRISDTLSRQKQLIRDALSIAEEKGDEELAQEIKALDGETSSYVKEQVFSSAKKDEIIIEE
jgi:hypothetical protein